MVGSECPDHLEAKAHPQWPLHELSPSAMTTARSLIAQARARASRVSLVRPSSGGYIYTSATSNTLSPSTQPLNHPSSDWPTRPPIVAASLPPAKYPSPHITRTVDCHWYFWGGMVFKTLSSQRYHQCSLVWKFVLPTRLPFGIFFS
jgi:hypothetical protein